MSIVKIDTTIFDEAGVPVLDKEAVFSVKTACARALLAPTEDKLTPEEKYDRYKLFQRFDKEKSILELSSEEISKVKAAIGAAYPALVVGQVWDCLEGKV